MQADTILEELADNGEELDIALSSRIPVEWPETGRISMHSVGLQYSPDGPWVLRNIDLDVRSGEKIGFVGRTGLTSPHWFSSCHLARLAGHLAERASNQLMSCK